jgi:hypothetical protein
MCSITRIALPSFADHALVETLVVLMLSRIHCLQGELGSLASLQQEPHEFARLLPLRIRRCSSTALPSSFPTWPTGLCLSLQKR